MMNFSSSFVYDGEADEVEIDDVEMEAANMQEYGSNFASVPKPQQQSSSIGGFFSNLLGKKDIPTARKARPMPAVRKLRKQKVGLNIVSLNLGSLATQSSTVSTGDPIICSNDNCKAHFSVVSNLTKMSDNKNNEDIGDKDSVLVTKWECEFCGTSNIVDIPEQEIPTTDTVDYVITPAAYSENKATDDDDTRMVIFAIDCSGSMCVTQEVQGALNLKTRVAKKDEFAGLLQAGDDRSAMHTQKNKKITYVSRLEAVQAAVQAQLSDLGKKFPSRFVGLLTFSNEIRIIGDGNSEIITVAGDKLKDQALLQQIGTSYVGMERPIRESEQQLTDKLFEFETGGQTALGPALVIAVSMASKRNGSKVILCTDGLANVGLGNLPNKNADSELLKNVENFYDGIGNFAKISGCTVSVISITQDEAKLEMLGRVCDLSGGVVERVNPLELSKNFQGIIDNVLVATHVQASFLLHSGLRFSEDGNSQVNEEKKEEKVINRKIQDIGNCFADTEIYFEYFFASKKEMEKYKNLSNIPFQVHVDYTKLDGTKCRRVISRVKPITHDRQEAEKHLNVAMLAANAMQKSSALAQQGNYEDARANMWSHAQILGKAAKTEQQQSVYSNFLNKGNEFDDQIHELQANEAEEDIVVLDEPTEDTRIKRAAKRNDKVATAMYKNKKLNAAALL